ncbi:MAG: hypothetical protein ABSE47_05875 [Acidimicrobiales bacterium]
MTIFTVVFVLIGTAVTYEINHHRDQSEILLVTTTTAPSGPNRPAPAAAAPRVPFSDGYSSDGWQVVPGSIVRPTAKERYDTFGQVFASIRLRNEHPTAQSVIFDVWVYVPGDVPLDLETSSGAGPVVAGPGATVTVVLVENSGPVFPTGASVANFPLAPYVFVVDQTVPAGSGSG